MRFLLLFNIWYSAEYFLLISRIPNSRKIFLLQYIILASNFYYYKFYIIINLNCLLITYHVTNNKYFHKVYGNSNFSLHHAHKFHVPFINAGLKSRRNFQKRNWPTLLPSRPVGITSYGAVT